jgi:hypothetical protein
MDIRELQKNLSKERALIAVLKDSQIKMENEIDEKEIIIKGLTVRN